MRIIITALWSGLFCFLGSPASAEVPDTFSGEIDSYSYTRLIDTNQSQTFEPMSVSILSRYPKLAKVHFIVSDANTLGFDYTAQKFDPDNNQKCINLGFTYCLPGEDTCKRKVIKVVYENETVIEKTETIELETCTEDKLPGRACPYDATLTDGCCDTKYKYSRSECTYPRTLGGSCNGKYECSCDLNLYRYTSDNCPEPAVLSNRCWDDSGDHFAECGCPSYYKPCDSSKNLVGVGAMCESYDDAVYASCECKAGYNQVCE